MHRLLALSREGAAAVGSFRTAKALTLMADDARPELQKAAEVIREATALLICTGAGMGVDSGLGTFRGANAGIWPPLRVMRMDFSEMSDPMWFEKDPRLAWAFWHFRHQAYTKGNPHEGYGMLARWGQSKPHGFFTVTSNIDGHWLRTDGVSEEQIYECHGAVTHMQFVKEDNGTHPWRTDDAQISALDVPVWDLAPGDEVEARLPSGRWVSVVVDKDGGVVFDGKPVAADAVRKPGGEDLLRVREGCPLPRSSGEEIRPNVMMFNDYGINCTRIDAQLKCFQGWAARLPKDARLAIVEVGAGTAVRTIRAIGESTARKFPNASFIRINLEDSAIPRFERGISIGGLGALDALSWIDKFLSPPAPSQRSNDRDVQP